MVRPNQIISSDVNNHKLTFIMFGRNPQQASRRVLFLNFPGKAVQNVLLGQKRVKDYVSSVDTVSSGKVNRYAVTVDTSEI